MKERFLSLLIPPTSENPHCTKAVPTFRLSAMPPAPRAIIVPGHELRPAENGNIDPRGSVASRCNWGAALAVWPAAGPASSTCLRINISPHYLADECFYFQHAQLAALGFCTPGSVVLQLTANLGHHDCASQVIPDLLNFSTMYVDSRGQAGGMRCPKLAVICACTSGGSATEVSSTTQTYTATQGRGTTSGAWK